MLNGKVTIVFLIFRLIRNILPYESYFPPYSYSKNKVEFELDFSNYTTQSYLKNAKYVDRSQFARKDDVANLKSEVDKLHVDKLSELDADKLKSVPTDLIKLSDVLKNDIVKKKVILLQSKVLKIKYVVLPT